MNCTENNSPDIGGILSTTWKRLRHSCAKGLITIRKFSCKPLYCSSMLRKLISALYKLSYFNIIKLLKCFADLCLLWQNGVVGWMGEVHSLSRHSLSAPDHGWRNTESQDGLKFPFILHSR